MYRNSECTEEGDCRLQWRLVVGETIANVGPAFESLVQCEMRARVRGVEQTNRFGYSSLKKAVGTKDVAHLFLFHGFVKVEFDDGIFIEFPANPQTRMR